MHGSRYDTMEKALRFLVEQAPVKAALEEVAAHAGMSSFHFQRTFSAWVGLSPARFSAMLARQHLRMLLKVSASIDEAADRAGMSGQSRVHDLFVTLDAMTPGEMLRGGAGLTIRHGVHDTRFGHAFIAATNRGVCQLAFIEPQDARREIERLRAAWPGAELVDDFAATGEVAARLFLPPAPGQSALPLLVRGTNFQVKVWEALLRVPPGQLTTYGRIAAAIGAPRASRAVGGAVGANPIAWLIPCHRVIREEGILGNYRWGAPRKAALLAWELQAMTARNED